MSSKGEGEKHKDFFDICSRCKTDYSCCRRTLPPITEGRRRLIEAYLKNRGLSAKNAFAEHEYVYPRVKADGYCIFHNIKTRECNIHPVKPETCVAGPITFDVNTESGKIELHIKMKKICLLAGVVYKDKALLRQHLKPAKQEILKLLNELSSKELKAILKKEEPETFKIAEEPAEKSVLIKMRQKCS